MELQELLILEVVEVVDAVEIQAMLVVETEPMEVLVL
jgi:hypothetical protein